MATATLDTTATAIVPNYVRMPRRKFEQIRVDIAGKIFDRAEYYLEISDAYESAGMEYHATAAMQTAGSLNNLAYKVSQMSRREFAQYMERIETRRRVQRETVAAAPVAVRKFGWVATITRLIVGKF